MDRSANRVESISGVASGIICFRHAKRTMILQDFKKINQHLSIDVAEIEFLFFLLLRSAIPL